MRSTKCIFTVTHSEQVGTKHVYDEEGNYVDTGQPTFNVQATPWYSDDPNHPNVKFFELTPSGQLQLYNVVNFDPPVGAEIEMVLSWAD